MDVRLKIIARQQKALRNGLMRVIRAGGSNEDMLAAVDAPSMDALYQRMSRLGLGFARGGVRITLTPEEVLQRRDHVTAKRRERRLAR